LVALHHLNTPPPALPDELAPYQRLMDKLVEKDRDARFRNADEVLGYLARKFDQPMFDSRKPSPCTEKKGSKVPSLRAALNKQSVKKLGVSIFPAVATCVV
jgi:hypothetical protein